jgi:glycerol-3-phosphate dehydrogenase
MSEGVAENLVKSYGSRAWEVCELTKPTHRRWPKFGRKLADNYPYIDADVSWACREYACTIEDVLSRRTRLAFLNRDAALEALPAVADIMAKELGWTDKVKQQQIVAAEKYVNSYSGRISENFHYKLKSAKYENVRDVFDVINTSENGDLHKHEVEEVAEILGLKLTKTELEKVFKEMDKTGTGRVSYEAFEHWWNEAANSPFHRVLCKELGLFGMKDEDLKEMGGGALFG